MTNAEKDAAIVALRNKFRTSDHRGHIRNRVTKTPDQLLALINDKGQFTDLVAKENEIADDIHTSIYSTVNSKAGNLLGEAWRRIWKIADKYRNDANRINGLTAKYKKCIMYYGELEINRPNVGGRFLQSCFDMASAATGSYFCFLSVMNDVESGKITDQSIIDVCNMFKVVGLQAWTQPYREDNTDNDIVDVERFRQHVWWVGANGLAYRAVMHVAAMYSSIPMNDVLSTVAQKAISYTSQQTLNSAFWTEGLTADGAGWGHGMQCNVWGYPVQGVSAAVSFITNYKGTPWVKTLSEANKDAIFVLLRGTSWFYHKGYTVPAIGRTTMQYNPETTEIGSKSILENMINHWKDSFTAAEQKELTDLLAEVKKKDIYMENYPAGHYHGTRYYFNNDDLIKRTKDYHVIINMNSSRCDGVEMDVAGNDRMNFFLTDGATYFQRKGNEYSHAFGAFDITRAGGVTAREGMNLLQPKTDWRGYKGMHNFAGGATLGGQNAVCGMQYQKDAGALSTPMLYDVESYKGYFYFGDYLLCLGAGVTNKNTSTAGTIRTGIEQTIKSAGGAFVYKNGEETTMDSGTKYNFVEGGKSCWAMQKGGFAYTVLPEYIKGNAYFMIENKMTYWDLMSANPSNKKATNSKIDIFSAWVDHGKNANNDTYAYVVYLGKGTPGEIPFTVAKNDKVAQVAISKDDKIFGAVIYNSLMPISCGSWTVKSSNKAIVYIEKTDHDGMKISVSDPTMTYSLRQITLTINGKRIVVPLPTGDQAGKPAIYYHNTSSCAPAQIANNIVVKKRTIAVKNMIGANLQIFNSNGVALLSQEIKSNSENISLNSFISGAYVVSCNHQGAKLSKKILL